MLLGMDSGRLLGGVQVSMDGYTIKFNVEEIFVSATAASYLATNEICLPVFKKTVNKDFKAKFKNILKFCSPTTIW